MERVTGSSPVGGGTAVFPHLNSSLGVQIRKLDEPPNPRPPPRPKQASKLDESLSGFCSRQRKTGKREKGVKTFPSSKPTATPSVPRTPLPTYSAKVWKLVEFFRKCQFPPALFSAPTDLLSVPGSLPPASGPLHLLLSWFLEASPLPQGLCIYCSPVQFSSDFLFRSKVSSLKRLPLPTASVYPHTL